MSTILHIPSMRPEPERDNYGRYLLPDPVTGTKKPWTRATTLAHTLSDDYNITQWKRRMVAEGLAKKPELVEQVARASEQLATADHWKTQKAMKAVLDDLCDQAAREAGAEDGSKLGTLLHTITEYADADRLDEIEEHLTPELRKDLDAYMQVMDAAGISRPAEWIERIIVNRTLESAGTFDRLLFMPDGTPVIGDLKTQKTVEFGFMEIAIQLAEYANADAVLDYDTGQMVPMPENIEKRYGIVMHLPVGSATCTLYKVDLEQGWRAAQTAHTTRQLRTDSKKMGSEWRPMPVPTQAEVSAQTLYLIRNAGHPDALAAIWRSVRERGAVWTPEYQEAAVARKAELLGELAVAA